MNTSDAITNPTAASMMGHRIVPQWIELSQAELDAWHKTQLEAMPAELRQPCPYCQAPVGYSCMTRHGEWAKWSHKKRRELTA